MEVAGQWRREWAGTAEYGKVTEGGITRRVARAMEVLHASAPGARVRVMRAAYHSSAGPGLPASSYLVHSSRQVISSGNHFLDTALPPVKPQEISSTPLDITQDSEAEKENYKVTEPDDFDISEPSKWKASSAKSSIRMPSEESSSTDNASIIDLDSLSNRRSLLRRSFREKEKDVSSSHKRVSPLLDAPIALSTLKYTSLLNGTDDWNSRRKSYSFEDTSSINNNLRGSDSLTIDSSTDSGIYKSTEIVDEHKESGFKQTEDNTFQDWLLRNRASKFKSAKTHNTNNSAISNNISLKSTGKVTITLPVTIESENSDSHSIDKSKINDENDRKSKKVEFCKTELHFAVDSGTVNIIATDEKPPPSNDFRKRRSAFVPLNDRIDKSIMLFGDKVEHAETVNENISIGDFENIENTAATKSILKNKIPKPKPYLLGENMDFGDSRTNTTNDLQFNLTTPSAVSFINKQLQSRRFSDETTSSSISDTNKTPTPYNSSRTTNTSSEKGNGFVRQFKDIGNISISPVKERSATLSSKYTLGNTRTRELRTSDLAYFGINNTDDENTYNQNNLQEEILHSVKLVQQVSSSVSNSEIDSDDAPEYENLPYTSNPVIPTPKPRSKLKREIKTYTESKALNPIPEQDIRSTGEQMKSKLRSKKDLLIQDDRDPAKATKMNLMERKSIKTPREEPAQRTKQHDVLLNYSINEPKCVARKVSPLYVNLTEEKRRMTPINSTKKKLERKSSTGANRTPNDSKYIKRNSQDTSNSIERNFAKKKTETLIKDPVIQQNSIKGHDKTTINTKKQNSQQVSLGKDRERRSKDRSPIKDSKHSDSKKDYGKHNKTPDISIESKNKISEIKIHRTANKENSDRRSCDYYNTDGLSQQIEKKIPKTSAQHKLKKIEISDGKNNTNTKSDTDRKSKRSKYVINYDDKNGTVSSICKIKPGAGSYSRKTLIPSKESPDENNKGYMTSKLITQQRRDHERIMERAKYKDREKKRRVKSHNSCHLL